MAQYDKPLLNTHFKVIFINKYFSLNEESFQSVQGLKGMLRKSERSGRTYPYFENIILRRAYQPNSELVKWCMDNINNSLYKSRYKQPLDISVSLLNSMHEPICGWHIKGAVPIAWGVEDLHGQDPKILIETIELAYEYFQVSNSEGKIIAPKIKASWFSNLFRI